MDERTALLEQLAIAKWQVEQGDVPIAGRKRIVTELAAMGRETTEAEMALQVFERTQGEHLAQVERILDALDKLPLFEDLQ